MGFLSGKLSDFLPKVNGMRINEDARFRASLGLGWKDRGAAATNVGNLAANMTILV